MTEDFTILPDRPFHSVRASRSEDQLIQCNSGKIVQRILRLKCCESVGRVFCLNKNPPIKKLHIAWTRVTMNFPGSSFFGNLWSGNLFSVSFPQLRDLQDGSRVGCDPRPPHHDDQRDQGLGQIRSGLPGELDEAEGGHRPGDAPADPGGPVRTSLPVQAGRSGAHEQQPTAQEVGSM